MAPWTQVTDVTGISLTVLLSSAEWVYGVMSACRQRCPDVLGEIDAHSAPKPLVLYATTWDFGHNACRSRSVLHTHECIVGSR